MGWVGWVPPAACCVTRGSSSLGHSHNTIITTSPTLASTQAGKKGVHAPGEAPPPPRVTDLSLDARKARSYLPHLQREADVRAVVEYVFSGSRFKVRS